MKAIQLLPNLEQSIWLDNITLDLLESRQRIEGAKDDRRLNENESGRGTPRSKETHGRP